MKSNTENWIRNSIGVDDLKGKKKIILEWKSKPKTERMKWNKSEKCIHTTDTSLWREMQNVSQNNRFNESLPWNKYGCAFVFSLIIISGKSEPKKKQQQFTKL